MSVTRLMGLAEAMCCKDIKPDVRAAVEIMDAVGPATGDPVRELYGYVASGHLYAMRGLAAPWELGGPLFTSRDVALDFDRLSYAALKRTQGPTRVITFLTPAPRMRRIYGTRTAKGINFAALLHDLMLARLYARFAREQPQRAVDWVPDSSRRAVAEHQAKVPDVVLTDASGIPYLVIELAGCYSASKLKDFHSYCTDTLGLHYEVY